MKDFKIQEIFTFKFLTNKSKFWKFFHSSYFKDLYFYLSYFERVTHDRRKIEVLLTTDRLPCILRSPVTWSLR